MNYQSFLLSILLSSLAFNLTFGQAKLGFSLQNVQVVGNSLEFDIYAVANVSNTYHSRGQIYIDYNPLAFGDSIVARGNATYTPLSLVNETVPVFGSKYSTIGFIDNTVNRLAITWQTNFPAATPATLTHTLVPATFTPIYHISIQIQNSSVPVQIALAEHLMIGQQFHITAPSWEVPYHDWPLPVEFMNFEGEVLNERQVQLEWATSLEINNDYFILEKQQGPMGNFEPITTIPGAGTTDEPTFYTYIDQSPMSEVNYYRLKQVDIDGLFSYSGIVEIQFDGVPANSVTIFPNPTADVAKVKLHSLEQGTFSFQLVDQAGKRLKLGHILNIETVSEVQLDISEFPAGIYYLQMMAPSGKIESLKVVKI